MDTIVQFPDREGLNSFRDSVFQSVGAADHGQFSAILIEAHESGKNLTAEVQDKIMSSADFMNFAKAPAWKTMTAKCLDVPEDEVITVFPHLRLDLPSSFSDDQSKMSLPWHQEAGYYLAKGCCSPKSVVISTYLHDCCRVCGALEIGADEYADLEPHDSSYMNEEQKRFKRVQCRAPERSEFKETSYGDSVIFDFLVPHRSGRNETTVTVRITMLVRAGWKKDIDEWQLGNIPSKP